MNFKKWLVILFEKPEVTYLAMPLIDSFQQGSNTCRCAFSHYTLALYKITSIFSGRFLNQSAKFSKYNLLLIQASPLRKSCDLLLSTLLTFRIIKALLQILSFGYELPFGHDSINIFFLV